MKEKSCLIVGLGKSGLAALNQLINAGASVSVYDQREAEKLDQLAKEAVSSVREAFLGREPEDVSRFDYIVMSPGVPLTLPFLERAEAAGCEIIGELELAYRLGKGNYIAITGTNGKTTTTTLIGEILKRAGWKTSVVGNIGVPVITASVTAEDQDWLVTECSSFQLETVKRFRPKVSVMLNLTPDHMDRHKTMKCYGAAKAQIFAAQTEEDCLIINKDDQACFALAAGCAAKIIPFSVKEKLAPGIWLNGETITVTDLEGQSHEVCRKDELIIPGAHNLENAMAAAGAAYFAGVPEEVIAEELRSFSGVEHRLEFCLEVKGIRFVNDSKGTNPDASIKAIEAMKGGTVLIAGGYDKNSSFDQLVEAFGTKVKALVLLGATAGLIKETAEKHGFANIHVEKDMAGCVKKAYSLAEPGDTVLLSPACASWDMYSSYEERGRDFKQRASDLKIE